MIDLDTQVLDHMALDASVRRMFRERIDSELVLDKRARRVFEYTLDFLLANAQVPAPEVLSYEFDGVTFEEPLCEIDWLIEKLRERHTRNTLKKALRAASSDLAEDPTAALTKLSTEISGINASTRTRDIAMDASDWDTAFTSYKDRVNSGAFEGVTLGYWEMDDALGGLRNKTLTFILARPKRFKSWQLLKSGREAQSQGKQGVFFSLEMSKEEMFDRYLCMVAGIPYGLFMKGRLERKHYDLIRAAGENAKQLEKPLLFLKPPRGQRTVQHLVELAQEHGAEAVYIDQLSFLEATRRLKADQRHMEIGYICEDLKDATETLNLPIYCAAQFNREAANLTEMADLSKIGLSDAIGQTADLLLGIYANRDMLQNRIIEMGVVDGRSVEPARWHLHVEVSSRSDFEVKQRIDL